MTDLPTQYQQYIHLSRYARWNPEAGRRETWDETVGRLIHFWEGRLPEAMHPQLSEIADAIRNLEIMPSMRTLMTAGPALERDNVAGYNCAYVAVDHPRVFDEILYILMCGTGVGFSVERQNVSQLPVVPEEIHETDSTIVVSDSKIGWASAYRELIGLLYSGKSPRWDVSRVRPSGAILKTFGGRASGPEPLNELFRFTRDVFYSARGRKLSSIECHDIVCKVAQSVVVGGVRRSALISLSNLTDERMRGAKSGAWWENFGHRALANNSVAYTEKPDPLIFLKEFTSLVESKSGERGIFNRVASQKQALSNGRRDIEGHEYGTNPCSEIILRSKQFCNLTEVVVRPSDTLDDLRRKVRLAAILGTFQSTLTNFRYLSSAWRKNTEEERLLGVSLTGIMDHPVLNGGQGTSLEGWLHAMKKEAVGANAEYANYLGIPVSAAITCVKPSGTVSQMVDSASGIHARHAPYYIRRVRAAQSDPLAKFMVASGFPVEADVTAPNNTWVFSFPMKAPDNAVFRNDRTAIQQLELWKTYQLHWCEHKPSITVTVKEDEWVEVAAWCWANFDILSGVSFLPHSDHTYRQAPYEDCTEREYRGLLESVPKVDWSLLSRFESEDHTTSSQELACVGGQCEL